MVRRPIAALAAVLWGSAGCNAILGIQVFSGDGTGDSGIDTGVDSGTAASGPSDAEFRDANANLDVETADGGRSTAADAVAHDSAFEGAADSTRNGDGSSTTDVTSTSDVTADNSAPLDGTADSTTDGLGMHQRLRRERNPMRAQRSGELPRSTKRLYPMGCDNGVRGSPSVQVNERGRCVRLRRKHMHASGRRGLPGRADSRNLLKGRRRLLLRRFDLDMRLPKVMLGHGADRGMLALVRR